MTGTVTSAGSTHGSDPILTGMAAVSEVVANTRSLRRGLRDLNRILRPEFGVTVRRVLTVDEWRAALAPPASGSGAGDEVVATKDGVTVAIRRRGIPIGGAEVVLHGADSAVDATVLRLVAAACAVMLEGSALRRRARDAERRLAAVSERERIARGVHDTVGARIGTIGRRVAGHLADTRDGPWRRRLEELLELSYEADRDVREAVHALLYLDARRDGIVPSLHALAARFTVTSGASCDVSVTGSPSAMSGTREDALFRVAHEALVNTQRHARASAVGIALDFAADAITLTIRDDGVGIAHRDPFAVPGRFGLRAMRDRVRHVGGTLHVTVGRPRGVVIEATVPLPQRRNRSKAGGQ